MPKACTRPSHKTPERNDRFVESSDWKENFIRHLERLRDQEDRRALAILRRGANRQPGAALDMFSLVIPWVPENRHAEDSAFLVAALFALHPAPKGQGTLGSVFAKISEESDSIELRVNALLNCHRDDLPYHLRQAVSLLRSKDVPVNWRQLLRDVLGWEHDDRYVQRAWARDFWSA